MPPKVRPAAPPPLSAKQKSILADFTHRRLDDEEAGRIGTLNATACEYSLAIEQMVPAGKDQAKALQLARISFLLAADGIAKAPPKPRLKVKAPKHADSPPPDPGSDPRMDPDPPVRPGRRRPRARRGDG